MGHSGPPPRAACARALMGASAAASRRARRCHADRRSWSSSRKEAAAQCVWALGVSMNLQKETLFALEVHLLTAQLFSSLLSAAQRSLTPFLMGTKLEPCT